MMVASPALPALSALSAPSSACGSERVIQCRAYLQRRRRKAKRGVPPRAREREGRHQFRSAGVGALLFPLRSSSMASPSHPLFLPFDCSASAKETNSRLKAVPRARRWTESSDLWTRDGPRFGCRSFFLFFSFRGRRATLTKNKRIFRLHLHALQLPYLGLARGDDVVQAHAQARLKAQGSRKGGHFFVA